jgi:hypothetical protein
MNWETALTTLWNKISKPVSNILIGAVFLFVAPTNISWFGGIFIAIGVGGFLDKQFQLIPEKLKQLKKEKEIKEEIENATDEEINLLKLMLHHNKRIMINTDFVNSLEQRNITRGGQLPSKIYDLFRSLDDKNLLCYDSGFDGYFKITVLDTVWHILKKLYKKDFNTVAKKDDGAA